MQPARNTSTGTRGKNAHLCLAGADVADSRDTSGIAHLNGDGESEGESNEIIIEIDRDRVWIKMVIP